MLRWIARLVARLLGHLRLGLRARFFYGLWAVLWLLGFIFSGGLETGPSVQSLITLASGFVLIFSAFWLTSALFESRAWRKMFRHGTGGSARWSGPLEFFKHRFDPKGKAPIYFGETLAKYDPLPGGQQIGVDDENHLVTIAQSRSGKSTTAIWPNLVRFPYPGSAFILDPKGEHALCTAGKRRQQGFRTVVLDPFNETKGQLRRSGFNPLAELDPESPRAKEDIIAIASGFVISSKSNSGTSDHFDKLQRAVIAGLIAHVVTTLPKEQHHLPAIYDFFMRIADGDGSGFEKLMQDMARNSACGGLPKEAAAAHAQAGPNERGSIFTTTLSNLSWMASKGMREHLTTESGFKLSDLRTMDTTVYVVLDFDAMKADKQGRYMRLLIEMAFEACRKTPLDEDRKAEGRRTLFILDEVAQLGPMPSIANAYRTLAGSHVKIWTFFQNWEALSENYDAPSDLMGNATKQFFGCNDPETASAIEGYLGSWRAGPRDQISLLDATEIQDTLGQKAPAQIVITGGGAKFELKRVPTLLEPDPGPMGYQQRMGRRLPGSKHVDRGIDPEVMALDDVKQARSKFTDAYNECFRLEKCTSPPTFDEVAAAEKHLTEMAGALDDLVQSHYDARREKLKTTQPAAAKAPAGDAGDVAGVSPANNQWTDEQKSAMKYFGVKEATAANTENIMLAAHFLVLRVELLDDRPESEHPIIEKHFDVLMDMVAA